MIRKIIILGLIGMALLIFYKKFVADIMEPFFRKNRGNVEFIQKKIPDYKIQE